MKYALALALIVVSSGCGGGATEETETQAWELSANPGGAAPARRLAAPDSDFRAIVFDDDHVYWSSDRGQIWRVTKQGGWPELLVDPSKISGQYILGLAVDDEAIYWTDLTRGTVLKRSKRDGIVTVLASEQNRPYRVVVDGTRVYWTVQGDFSANMTSAKTGAVRAVDKRGGVPVTLADKEQLPTELAMDDVSVYFASGPWGDRNGSIRRVPKRGGAVQVMVSDQSTIRALAARGGNVYFVEDRTPALSPFRGALLRVSVDGAYAVLDPDVSIAGPLTLSGNGIAYSALFDSPRRAEIRWVPIDGSTPWVLLAQRTYRRRANTIGVTAIAVDDKMGYWGDFYWDYDGARSGSLMAAPFAR
ncbi:hypothetical protein LZC95_51340 [Pendulispora brunnea]|uniref:Uncharacterized protein n=1 Tax=Pendulispora brunnea TaxID=2905690 RepID=A0ABZ2KCJ5_9BACT